jgi:predicted TIM-barrel fold metal-dependent hydrolase
MSHSARAFLLALLLPGCSLIYDSVGGAFRREPSQMAHELSPGARKLLDDAFEGIDLLTDYHVHAISKHVHPSWLSWWHPIRRGRTMVYLSAAGVSRTESLVEDYEERLMDLIRHIPGRTRIHVMALDRYHLPDGTADPERTSIYVPNEQVMELAARHPDVIAAVISVHPYRRDALVELERWAAQGCRYVKWLPNSMGMDPSSEQTEAFYRRMVELGMVLLSHTGDEDGLEEPRPELGNPLLLRKPLDMGLRVVALHSASNCTSIDLDSPGREEVPSFDLFLRLMEEPRYEGLLFGEISTLTFFNHLPRPLLTLLEREDLHHRLVNGSDYPLCALNIVIRTSRLVRLGVLTAEEKKHLDEIYDFNPLLFDFAVKRTVRHPASGRRFSSVVFLPHPELAAAGAPAREAQP